MHQPQTVQSLNVLRHQHSAWQLLASRRAPLVLACLQPLFDSTNKTVSLEDAEAYLSDTFTNFANDESLGVQTDNFSLQARRELRMWIKKGLIIERQGEIFATDALQRVLQFIDGLSEKRLMTSTASRLSTVQQKIEQLSIRLSTDVDVRRDYINKEIQRLQEQLEELNEGNFNVLTDSEAIEEIQDLYSLAMSLKDDFRRVEDTYRDADRDLRQKIIQTQTHRGEVIDQLLDNHDMLLQTAEGRVFEHFHKQLQNSVQLDNSKRHLREIMHCPSSSHALSIQQQNDLRWLFMGLTLEAGKVGEARARSERDVCQFMRTGLASEHHRVGQLLNELLEVAIDINWQQVSVRRGKTPLPPIGVDIGAVPIIERLRAKDIITESAGSSLDLQPKNMELDEMDGEFWRSFDSLDRLQLVDDTLNILQQAAKPLSLLELAEHYQHCDSNTFARHDLEIFSLWVSLARETGIAIDNSIQQTIETYVDDSDDTQSLGYRFYLPSVELDYQRIKNISHEI